MITSAFVSPRRVVPALVLTLMLPAWVDATPTQFDQGNSAAAITQAARTFLESLEPEQRAVAQLPFDTPQRFDWHFIPKPRKGLTLSAMNEDQRDAALELLKASLSPSAYAKAKYILIMEEVIRIQENDKTGRRDRLKFHWTVFGQPGPNADWGYSIEGHHLSVNVTFKEGRLISTTPLFLGLNPRRLNGEFDFVPMPKGYEPLAEEENAALALMASLSESQRVKAVLPPEQFAVIKTGPIHRLYSGDPVGVAASEFTPDQMTLLKKLVQAYLDRMIPEEAARSLDEIEQAGWEAIHFAWAGPVEKDQPWTFRVQGPTFIIDFDNSQADPLGTPANHLHSLWRNRLRDFGGK
ncbi:hypothetical protein Isop_0758 [Isosphaera pallida ATCC 43644]|uniref:DUF3500 domain-containing protein n=1 Tax=Isosphaera pallida (strain ATCC 43644 / DSM 9630 / IS1B) TaxID=575540 RepID=E8R1S7_ISOPI|nr:DUF3500 domain-containing protein [Isosphaera pallida]ADV61349.1 hypothetical protein Isop_0758 [Isosphaera pallida ATCC 43644]